jgi:L-iditol 2-dehydrogenase
MTGRHNLCVKLRFLSSPGDPGFFRDYVNLPARNLLALPPNVSTKEGSLVEPLAVVLHSMKFGQPKPGETAAVFGAGPIGLLTVAVLKLSGITRVWSIDPIPARRDLARQMGADAVLDVAHDIPAVDLVFDCAAKGDSLRQSIQVARSAGRVVFTGIPSEMESPIDFHTWRRKELSLYQVRRSNHEGEQARDILAAHLSRFAPLITHTHAINHIAQAFTQLEHYADGVGKSVVECSAS